MKDMKIMSKIFLVLLSVIWAAGLFFLVVYLCRELDWAIAIGQWVTDCWNNVFGTEKTVEGFFNQLSGVLVFGGIILSFITLVFVIVCVKINNEDDEEVEAERESKKRITKEEKKGLKEEDSKMKKEKKLFGKSKKAKETTEKAVEANKEVVKEAAKETDDFLSKLRKGK